MPHSAPFSIPSQHSDIVLLQFICIKQFSILRDKTFLAVCALSRLSVDASRQYSVLTMHRCCLRGAADVVFLFIIYYLFSSSFSLYSSCECVHFYSALRCRNQQSTNTYKMVSMSNVVVCACIKTKLPVPARSRSR